jgi:hypothetical protein
MKIDITHKTLEDSSLYENFESQVAKKQSATCIQVTSLDLRRDHHTELRISYLLILDEEKCKTRQ